MPEISYAKEKMSSALYSMSANDKDLRQRIFDAFMKFHPVEPKKLPKHLGKELESIYNDLSRAESLIIPDQGTVKTTLESMSNKELLKLSEKIVDFAFNILDEPE